MIKRFCDCCGKELKPEPIPTEPFIWWTLIMHGMSNITMTLCSKCFENKYGKKKDDTV